MADQTLEWLSKNYQKQFFLWMHLYDPHFPYQPPNLTKRSTSPILTTAKLPLPTPKSED